MPSDSFYAKEGENKAMGTVDDENLGVGQVLSSKPFRDEDKHKFWIYKVQFKNADGAVIEKEIIEFAENAGIELFPKRSDLPTDFPVEPFAPNFDEKFAEVKAGISSLVQHEGLTELEASEWELFFASVPKDVNPS